MTSKLSPIHPSEVLLDEFIKPMNLSQNRLAIDIGVDGRRINEIVLGKRAITADTASRLLRFFGNSPQFWMELQTAGSGSPASGNRRMNNKERLISSRSLCLAGVLSWSSERGRDK
jgi:antitoxin HigA-1